MGVLRLAEIELRHTASRVRGTLHMPAIQETVYRCVWNVKVPRIMPYLVGLVTNPLVLLRAASLGCVPGLPVHRTDTYMTLHMLAYTDS